VAVTFGLGSASAIAANQSASAGGHRLAADVPLTAGASVSGVRRMLRARRTHLGHPGFAVLGVMGVQSGSATALERAAPVRIALPYRYDSAAQQLTAICTATVGPTDAWAAAETVPVGQADPCGPLNCATGDGTDTETSGRTQAGPDPRQRGDAPGDCGFALHRDEVTITLTGSIDDQAVLRAAIEAARPASDTDLRKRTEPIPVSLVGWLLR
jgi:hypothetical protein